MMKQIVFWGLVCMQGAVYADTVIELADVECQEYADQQKSNVLKGKIACSFTGKKERLRSEFVSKNKKGGMDEYTFFIPNAVESEQSKQIVARINQQTTPAYHVNLSFVQRKQKKGLQIVVRINDSLIELQNAPYMSIKGNPGIEFRFINKQLVKAAEKTVSERRATHIASNNQKSANKDASLQGGVLSGATNTAVISHNSVALSTNEEKNDSVKLPKSGRRAHKRFEHAINFVLVHEGGYNNDPVDAGGETKFGISKRSYPDIDIKNLTVEQAKAIYLRDFWNPQPYKYIKDLNVATKVFDLAVNMGPSWANKLIQRALKSTGHHIQEDGILTSETVAIINKTRLTHLLAALRSEAAGYYRTLAAIKPHYTKFLKGWLKRAYA